MTQKTEYAGMYKISEGVVLNKDNHALKSYKNKKKKDLAQSLEIKKMKEQIENTQNDISDIKNMLKILLDNK